MYIIVIPPDVKRQLRTFDSRYKSALGKAINRLSDNPYLGEPLVGDHQGLWRLRFSQYRIVYQIFKNKLVVLIVKVLHRKDVYRST